MIQLDLLTDKKIINVASVPQRSPFRYPGGKTWLVPYIRLWLARMERPCEFVEPFAGGAIIGLTVAAENLVSHVTLVELNDEVAAVWETILTGNANWLAEEISTFDLSIESVQAVLSKPASGLKEKAFQTILKNRINRGGILAKGAGIMKYGESGKGIKSRWYPETLKKRIMDIVQYRKKITFIEGDGIELIRQKSDNKGTAFFIDPPYTAAGKKAGTRLYSDFELDHDELFKAASAIEGNFLMTYENSDGVRRMAEKYSFDYETVNMKNTHNAEMTELLIGRNLDWIRK